MEDDAQHMMPRIGRERASVRDASLCMREMSRDVKCLEMLSPENRKIMRLNSMIFLSRVSV